MANSRLPMAVATIAVVLALVSPIVYGHLFQTPLLQEKVLPYVPEALASLFPSPSAPRDCPAPAHTTEIISVDPLVLYLRDFLTDAEAAALLALGEPLFAPSLLTGGAAAAPETRRSPRRTSSSARLPGGDDDFQPPQLVRYAPGQQFRLHADWFASPQARAPDAAGTGGPAWNRPASFLAVLEDACDGGETWFPFVDVGDATAEDGAWGAHADGGLAVRPVKRNALFWVNLFSNGTGDERTRHAGLPPTTGVKTALNIWPRVYYP
ncbi:hypothetical protein F4780DRAFT_790965 [Xylariomycetidae sp. FL0641]|nr:hypothetical protein F4780DRAFT_790965 [Xylariomycetidae sp. FL0641]